MTKHIELEELDPGVGQEWTPLSYPHSGWYWNPRLRTVVYVSKEPVAGIGGGACWAINVPPGSPEFFYSGRVPSVGDIPWVEVLKMIAIIEHPETAKELLK